MRSIALPLVVAAACSRTAAPRSTPCPGAIVDAWTSDPRLCLYTFADGLGQPRQLAFAPTGELFVNNGRVTVLYDDDHDGTSRADERATFATAPGLGHGIAFAPDARHVYASSQTTVFRWPYQPGARAATAPAEPVVTGIPAGGHVTRTLAFDSRGRLYVSVGSYSNVDTEPAQRDTRAQIRRFTVPDPLPAGGLPYTAGNDVHNDNPAEKVNLVDGTGATFYGYPTCFAEYRMPGGGGPGTLWADASLPPADRQSDAWCRDPANVHPPAFALPAHWAPLGIIEYQGTALPFGHDLLVTSHGSWDASPAVGRVLARLRRTGDTITAVEPVLGERGADDRLAQGTWRARPVDVREAPDGTLYLSDDAGGRVFHLTYAP
jgi:glucose/arabinose dehydrogenase